MNKTITTAQVADAMRIPLNPVRQMLIHKEFENIAPEPAYAGRHREFNAAQVLLMILAGDLVRFKIKAPLAASIAERAAKALLFDPNADALHVEFRANGASFVFTTDEAPDAALAAGAARFRLSFDLRGYRAAVDAAMTDDRDVA